MFENYEVKAMTARKLRIKNTSSVVLAGVKPGQVILVDADAAGWPLDRFWRNRIIDARRDGCVEVLPDNQAQAFENKDDFSKLEKKGKK